MSSDNPFSPNPANPTPPTPPPAPAYYPAPPPPGTPIYVTAPAPSSSSARTWIFYIIGGILCVALAFSMFGNLILFSALGKSSQTSETQDGIEFKAVQGSIWDDEWIAVIELSGMITSSTDMVDDYAKKIRAAGKNRKVKAIVVRINSPGGEVYASDVLYNETRKIRDEIKKPVVIYMETMATSGGYYMAMGGSYIIANDVTLTASIGVIMQSYNAQGLMELAKIKPVTFKSGKMKDMLSMFRDMTEEERAYIQALIDETYGKFVGIVAKERKIEEKVLREGIADGRVVSGKVALDNKLVDKLGYVEDAYTQARTMSRASNTCAIVQVNKVGSLAQLFGSLADSKTKPAGANTTVKLQIGPESLQLQAGQLYYLSSHLLLGQP
ncbi:MAG: signal peptide peptidase SppA [Candidatus Methylacidiphilales bacterium]